MSLYTLKQKKALVLGVTCILGLFIAYAVKDLFTAFLGAIVFYTLFRPFYFYLIHKRNLNRSLSAVIVLIITFFIIVLPFSFLCLVVIDKIVSFRDNPEQIQSIIRSIDYFGISQLNQEHLVQNLLDKLQTWALQILSSAINGILDFSLKLAVMYFIFYFMLVSYERFEATLIKYTPFREQNSMIFARELKYITYSNVLGQGFISVVQGALVGIGFLIFGLKDPFFWSVICVFLSFLPIVGSGLVFIPAGLIALSHGNTIGGYGIIIWGVILVTNIDNLIRMVINKKYADTHPLITIIGVVMGIPYFGILGLVFGPLLLSYFILLVKIYEIRYVQKRQIEPEEFQPNGIGTKRK